MIISIGSFVLKQRNKLPLFLKLSKTILDQAKNSKGNLTAELDHEGIVKFYSFTTWENKQAMVEFTHSNHHLKALQKTEELCKEAAFLYFESDHIIDLKTAKQKLITSKQTRVITF